MMLWASRIFAKAKTETDLCKTRESGNQMPFEQDYHITQLYTLHHIKQWVIVRSKPDNCSSSVVSDNAAGNRAVFNSPQLNLDSPLTSNTWPSRYSVVGGLVNSDPPPTQIWCLCLEAPPTGRSVGPFPCQEKVPITPSSRRPHSIASLWLLGFGTETHTGRQSGMNHVSVVDREYWKSSVNVRHFEGGEEIFFTRTNSSFFFVSSFSLSSSPITLRTSDLTTEYNCQLHPESL